MSLCIRDDNKKYFLNWNPQDETLDLTTWDYVHTGNKTILQISSTQSIGGSSFGSPIWGSWYDTTTQTSAIAGTATPMYCDSGSGNGIIKKFGSNFEVQHTGVYNIQFSVQLDQASGAGHHIYIWFRKNGVDIPYSASEVAIQGTTAEQIPSWNYVLEMNTGDYIQIMYSVTDTNVTLKAVSSTPVVPAIPSVIVTMWKI